MKFGGITGTITPNPLEDRYPLARIPHFSRLSERPERPHHLMTTESFHRAAMRHDYHGMILAVRARRYYVRSRLSYSTDAAAHSALGYHDVTRLTDWAS